MKKLTLIIVCLLMFSFVNSQSNSNPLSNSKPLSFLSTHLYPTDVSCVGCTDGAIDLVVTAGPAPVSYQWSTGATTQDIGNLAPGTYTVTVTHGISEKKIMSETIKNFSQLACDSIHTLFTQNVKITTAVLRWNIVPGAFGYQIRGTVAGSSSYVSFILPNGNATAFPASYLKGTTTYVWQIRPICAIDTSIIGPWSAFDTFTTMACPVPDSLEVIVHSPSSVTILWNKIPISAGSWIHFYSLDSTYSQIFDIFTGDSTSIRLDGLDCNRKYAWTVKIGCGNLSSFELSVFSKIDTFMITCDSIPPDTLVKSICDGDSVLFAGQYLTMSGVYSDTVTSSTGVDSITVCILTVIPSSSTTIDTTICTGDSVLINGVYYSAADTYTINLSSTGGCDSLLILIVNVNPGPNVTVCVDQNIPFFGPSGQNCNCSDKIHQLSVIYDGPAGATITVGPNSNGVNPTTYTNVQPGDTLSPNLGNIGNEWFWSVNGVVDANIHTSCSDDVLNNVNSSKSDFGHLGSYPNPDQSSNDGTFLVIGFVDGTGNSCGSISSNSSVCPEVRVNISVAGGSPPYTYMWSTGSTDSTLIDSTCTTKSYTVTVTDANGCQSTDVHTATVIDLSCDPNKVTMCHKFGTSNAHTHCIKIQDIQKKIDEGFRLGDCITTFDPGNCGPPMPPPPCDCDGKIIQLTLIYGGPNNATITVGPNSSGVNPTVYTNVQTGDTLIPTLGDIGNNWYFAVNGTVDAIIHTSCSDDVLGNINSHKSDFGHLGPYPNPDQGTILDGTFLVIGLADDKGNVCGPNNVGPPPPPFCDCDGKIVEMVVVYDGPAGATLKVGPNASGVNPTTYNNVQPGDTLSPNLGSIGNNWYWSVNGVVDANIHTSCSDDILGNVNSTKSDFGHLANYPNPDQGSNDGTFLVIGHTDENGNVCVIGQVVPKMSSANGIKYESPLGMNVFPNPNSGSYTIRIHNMTGDIGLIRILDITGKEILRKPVTEKSRKNQLVEVGMEMQEQGTYLIEFTSQDAIIIKRVTIF